MVKINPQDVTKMRVISEEIHDRIFYNAYHRTFTEKESEEIVKSVFEYRIKQLNNETLTAICQALIELINENLYKNLTEGFKERGEKLGLDYNEMCKISKYSLFKKLSEVINSLRPSDLVSKK